MAPTGVDAERIAIEDRITSVFAGEAVGRSLQPAPGPSAKPSDPATHSCLCPHELKL